ncbi:glycoside hydrolase family 97 protein [Labilibacter sediminis]|nr:glycoside hydrolase family 97 protein [Labilibacter sediminis]
MQIKFLILSLSLIFISCHKPSVYHFNSPNGKLQLNLYHDNGNCSFNCFHDGDTILLDSQLGLKIDSSDYTKNISVLDYTTSTLDDTWTTVNGKQKTIRNHYNEYLITVSKSNEQFPDYQIIFRLYNDGFAYRYQLHSKAPKDSTLIKHELTKLNFKNDYTYWAYNGERHNLGPVKRSEHKNNSVRTPMVIQLHNQKFMAIHEAEITRFAPYTMDASTDDFGLQFNVNYSRQANSFKTSWRSFIIGEDAGDLAVSDLLVNLNEPCKIEDPSWIKPGKSLWDWRVWGYKAADGFEYGLNTVSHKRMIDFASENNIQYLLIDADWYGEEFNENSDPTSSRKGINIEECMRYAKVKDVGIILYLNDIGAKKFGLERVLKQFSDWGAVGVKYGFMTGSKEDKVKHTRKVVELCAKYKLMVNFHDNPVPPSGERRTWPNLVTKEYCHAQADAKRSYYPETAVNMPLINMIAGPLDVTNGWFGLNNAHQRVRVFEEIPGTVTAEVAKLITIYSGWMVLPDSPEEYLKKDDLFDCIREMPAQFDDYKVLDAQLDEFISVARKSGNNWFVGSLTNRQSRQITINCSFLEEGKKYEATLYEDAKDSHYLNNKESYFIRKLNIDSNSKLKIKLAQGGGHAIYIRMMP